MANQFADKAEVQKQPCPKCGAAGGDICRSVLLPGRPGLRRNRMHDARVAMAHAKRAGWMCPNCESTQHVRCCQRCGANVPDPRRPFCGRPCEQRQADDDRISAQREREAQRGSP